MSVDQRPGRPSTTIAPAAPRSSFRPEIEGLRAVAAVLVAVYHIWIGRVSGGVDVFFVVSGFLITTTLLGQVARHGRVRPGLFLGRLARRLLPSALLVLGVVTVVTWFVVPEALRRNTFTEIIASALYAENWKLAIASVDYLDQNEPHTAVQHFWAMSIQGQFYVLWLVLFVIAGLVARSSVKRGRAVVTALLATTLVVSFGYSVWFTTVNQPFAYFSTPARAWEFAIGGLLVLVVSRLTPGPIVAAVLGWIGLLGVVTCGVLLSVSTSFPGYAALWPTLAAALVLVAGAVRDTPGTSAWVLSRPGLVWLGGISYGIYLWHWPLLVWFRHLSGDRTPGPFEGSLILGTAVVLAWGTSRLVERPIAAWRPSVKRPDAVKTTALVVVLALLVGGTTASISSLDSDAIRSSVRAEEAALSDSDCAGATAMLTGLDACASSADPTLLRPDPAALLEDTGGAYECYSPKGADEQTVCSFGTAGADTLRVAIVGNSHAAMIAAGLRSRLVDLDWTLDTFTGNGCVWGTLRAEACTARQSDTDSWLMEGEAYDLLIVTAGRGKRPATDEEIGSFVASWGPLMDRGTRIVVVEDNPRVPSAAADCVIRSSPADLVAGDCSFPAKDGYRVEDRMVQAADRVPGVDIVDLGEFYCADGVCPVVIGNVIVYRDDNHLTGTFVESLMPHFLERLDAVLDAEDR